VFLKYGVRNGFGGEIRGILHTVIQKRVLKRRSGFDEKLRDHIRQRLQVPFFGTGRVVAVAALPQPRNYVNASFI